MIKLKTLLKENVNKKLTVYHGTSVPFKTFNIKNSTQGIVWFTSNKNKIINGETGANGKGYIITAQITLNNPAGWDEYDKKSLGELKRDGYDGAVLPDREGNFDCFVFSNKQIKILGIEKDNFKPKLKPMIDEVIYTGMVGLHELTIFYDNADDKTKLEVDLMLQNDNTDKAWEIIKNFLSKIGKLTVLTEGYYPVVVGVITSDGQIKSEKTTKFHAELGFREICWRYNPTTKIIYWHGDENEHDESDEINVTDYLYKKYGYEVNRNITFDSIYYSNNMDVFNKHNDDAHGVCESKNVLSEDRSKKTVDHGCLMAFVSNKDSKNIIRINKKIIKNDMLYTGEDGMNRELEEIHSTIKYGFFPDLTKEEIEKIIKNINQFKITLKNISQFKNGKEKGFDVVKADVESDIIKKLNKAASKFPNEDEYDIYHPHLTLAYVKPNSFDKENKNLDMEVTIDKIVYSPIKGEKLYFDLPKEKINENKDFNPLHPKYVYPLAKKGDLHSYEGMEGWKGKLIWMSPDKFLSLANPITRGDERPESMQNIEHRIKNSLPLDFCVLEVDMKRKKVTSHEGRHRAMVSKKLGITEIPVLIFTGSNFERVPRWTKDVHDEVDKAEFKPEWYKMNETKLSDLKRKYLPIVKHKIELLEKEIERLDSMGGRDSEIRELQRELNTYNYQLQGMELIRESTNKKCYVGDCSNIIENGYLFNDATEMDQFVENSSFITCSQFFEKISLNAAPNILKLELRINPYKFEFGINNDVIFAYDTYKDIHYFFI